MFDFIPRNFKPGDWIDEELVGVELSFEDFAEMVGMLIVNDMSTESRKWYKIVQIEKIVIGDNGHRRLVYYDGKKQRGLVDEMYFNSEMRFPARAYKLNE